jgi:putative cell wall-binding protein
MRAYSADDYTAEAAALPEELAAALSADLGTTPADYLARADAAANASAVLDDLEARGIPIEASRLDGTTLVVTLPPEAAPAADPAPTADAPGASSADPSLDPVDAVEQAGAAVEFGTAAPRDQGAELAEFLADPDPKTLVGGQGYYWLQGSGVSLCSTAFNGRDRSTGRPQTLTAGHCEPTATATTPNPQVFRMQQSAPNVLDLSGPAIGTPLRSTYSMGGELDSGLIALDAGSTPRPAVGTWGDGTNAAPVTSGTPSIVRDLSRAIVGQPICKSGRTTGWTCGTVWKTDALVKVSDGAGGYVEVNSYLSDMCALRGDSGGAVVSGPYAVGVLSNGSFRTSCTETPGAGEADRFTGTFPLVARADYGSVVSSHPAWELQVDVAAPVVTSPAGGASAPLGSALSGTLASGGVRHTVRVTIDGSRTLTAPVRGGGSWSLDLSSVPAGAHTYSATALYGSGAATSAPVSGAFTLVAPAVSRIEGADRYQVAVAVAEKGFPGAATAPVVYVATGTTYPDALSAGPAAATQGGPLLLVLPDRIPDAVAAKITRLKPGRIVIVGGEASVGAPVFRALEKLVPTATVERLAGADRYAASRAVVASAFPEFPGGTVPHAYTATGTTFPDALSAGAAAGSRGEPVVLVYGPGSPAGTVDAATVDLFRAIGTTSLTLVGGVSSVSEGVATQLATGIPATVTRIDGANRYEASINLNRDSFASAGTVYLATGRTFPDALAGGVLAAAGDAPLYVVPGDCVPSGVIAGLARLGASQVVLLGGPKSLTPAVASLTPCAW